MIRPPPLDKHRRLCFLDKRPTKKRWLRVQGAAGKGCGGGGGSLAGHYGGRSMGSGEAVNGLIWEK